MSFRRCFLLSCIALATLCACDDGEEFVGVGHMRDRSLPGEDAGHDGGGAGHGGSHDASLPFDGGRPPSGATMDAAALMLDASISLPDGSWILSDGAIVLPDGDIIDRETAQERYEDPEPEIPTCEIDGEDANAFEADVEFSDEGGFVLVPGFTGFGLAYRAIGNPNGTGECRQALHVMHIPGSSGFPEPKQALSDCATLVDVALAADGKGWLLSWVDNLSGSAELNALALGAEMSAGEGVTRQLLSDEFEAFERKPVVKDVHGRMMVAFIADETRADEYRIHTRWLDDDDAENVEVVGTSAMQQPQALALSAIGTENAAVAWVGPEENPGVWLLPLDADGASRGTPIKLTDRVAASSSVDLAHRDDGGAVIYSIEIDGRPQVRFRRLDQAGMPRDEERVIVGAPFRAQGASLFPIGGGYVVAYRALPGGSVDKPEIRLLFISREGNVMRDSAGNLPTIRLADATVASSRTQVAVSVEGQIMVAWLDAGATHNALKVVRQRLDCR